MKVNSLWLLPVVLPVLPVFGKLTARKIIRPEVCLEKVEDLRATRSENDGTVECNTKHCSVKCQDGYQLRDHYVNLPKTTQIDRI